MWQCESSFDKKSFIFRGLILNEQFESFSAWETGLTTHIFLYFLFRPDHFWWKGQNRRTTEVGSFPRNTVEVQRKLASEYLIYNSILIIYTSHLKPNKRMPCLLKHWESWGLPPVLISCCLKCLYHLSFIIPLPHCFPMPLFVSNHPCFFLDDPVSLSWPLSQIESIGLQLFIYFFFYQ